MNNKPLSMTRHATLWRVAAPVTFRRLAHPGGIVVQEPLQTSAPAEARPVCSGWEVTFYDRTGNRELCRVPCPHYAGNASPSLWLVDGVWWEMMSGRVVWLSSAETLKSETLNSGGTWCLLREGWCHTPAARQANAGWPAWEGRPPTLWRRLMKALKWGK